MPNMKWGHIIAEVVMLYIKFAFVFFAYHFARMWTLQHRPSRNPRFTKQIGGYLRCIVAVAFVAMIVMALKDDKDENSRLDYNRGATVFLALLIPALFGAADGYATSEKLPPSSPTGFDEM